MKSVIRGLLAAVIGCAIFFACLVGWYELTGQGSGVFHTRRDASDAAVTIVGAQETPSVAQTPAGNPGNAAASSAVPSAPAASAADTGSAPAADSSSLVLVPTEESVPEGTDTAATDAAIDAYVETIRNELTGTYGDHLKVERSSRGITITLWEDGFVDRLAAGQSNGNTETLWNEKKDVLRQMTTAYYYRRADAGAGNVHIIANLLNEKQPDDIILSYEDGVLVHDGLDHD